MSPRRGNAKAATKAKREEQLNQALMTLWNVQGSLDLLVVHDIMGTLPEEVAALLRTVLASVDATVADLEGTV